MSLSLARWQNGDLIASTTLEYLSLFTVPDHLLEALIERVRYEGEFVSRNWYGDYFQLATGQVIGHYGEQHLVVLFAKEGHVLTAFPVVRKVSHDFHWMNTTERRELDPPPRQD